MTDKQMIDIIRYKEHHVKNMIKRTRESRQVLNDDSLSREQKRLLLDGADGVDGMMKQIFADNDEQNRERRVFAYMKSLGYFEYHRLFTDDGWDFLKNLTIHDDSPVILREARLWFDDCINGARELRLAKATEYKEIRKGYHAAKIAIIDHYKVMTGIALDPKITRKQLKRKIKELNSKIHIDKIKQMGRKLHE